MFVKHIIEGDAYVQLCPCTAIISEFIKCGKTKVLKHFLSNVVQTRGESTQSPLPENGKKKECMSCYNVIILGSKFFDKKWMMSFSEEEKVAMCLLSYFASLCKIRSVQDSLEDYHQLLEFAPLPATSECENISSEVCEQMKLLYLELMKQWEWLKKDEYAKKVVPSGVCLLNIFNIKDSQAAQDFQPFLSKYCKQSVNIACYDCTNDTEALKELAAKEDDHHCFNSTKGKLLKQLSGCIHKEQLVVLAAIEMGPTVQEPLERIKSLTEVVEKNLEIESVHHLQISYGFMENAKSLLEESVLDGPFYKYVPLKFVLLLHKLKDKCKSFWVERTEIESLSKMYQFDNGDLERCLKLFSSFGNIFYTHDIPSLKKYVIVDIEKFVKHMHDLYTSEECTAKYGLFKYRKEKEWKVVFEFLTSLGIAVQVQSKQILLDRNFSLDEATLLLYIPSARAMLTSSPNSAPYIHVHQEEPNSFDICSIKYRYLTENLQVLLCKRLLPNTNCLLLPAESVNTTIIRFHDIGSEEHDVQFIDMGDRVMMSLLNKDSIDSEKRKGVYKQIKQRALDIPYRIVHAAAKKLSTGTVGLLGLASRFELSQEWVWLQQAEDMTEREVIVSMLYEYKKKSTPECFIKLLRELGIQEFI